MASNEHKNLLDANRHNPKGFENANNNTFLGKRNGLSIDDKTGSLGWIYPLQTFVLRGSGVVSVATGVDNIRSPYIFRLTQVRASVAVAGTGLTTIDIKEGGVSILSTLLTIDASETTSTTAATPVVISDYDIADDASITFDVTAFTGAAARELRVYITGYIIQN
tara:strand:- start:5493 stop:5987 length:495 start_codon:yes stop_codon:yes gene_type:complete